MLIIGTVFCSDREGLSAHVVSAGEMPNISKIYNNSILENACSDTAVIGSYTGPPIRSNRD